MNDSPLHWHFRPLPEDRQRDYGDIAGFAFSEGLETLAREVAQNSVDARRADAPGVRLEIDVIELSDSHLAEFLESIRWEELKPHLTAAAASAKSRQVGRAIKPGLKMIDEEDRLLLLRISDFGTTGLLGNEYDDSPFAAVMRNKLDSNKGTTAGGSFGLGKAVMWASSRFGLVLAASNLSEPCDGKTAGRVFGRLELPFHVVGSDEWSGPAWIGAPTAGHNSVTESHWAEQELLERLVLGRNSGETGTSFLVVCAQDTSGAADSPEEMAAELREGIANSFWAAMTLGQAWDSTFAAAVSVERNGEVEDRQDIDPADYRPEHVKMLRKFYDADLPDALVAPGDVVCIDVDLEMTARHPNSELGDPGHDKMTHDARLLVALAEDVDGPGVNTISYMRGKRMVVKAAQARGLPLGARPFLAVVLAGQAAAEDEDDLDARLAEVFLRDAEPPEHNDWKGTRLLKDSYARGCQSRLDEFYERVGRAIRKVLAAGNEVDPSEKSSLSELLRIPQSSATGTKSPAVERITGSVDAEGRWVASVTVAVPDAKSSTWVLEPVAKFAGDGLDATVAWEGLEAGSGCEVLSDGSILTSKGAKRAVFVGTCSSKKLPVGAGWAALRVQIKKSSKAEVRP